MVTVTIADETRDLANASEHWITQSINERRQRGGPVCVRVSIELSGLRMALTTPGCPAGNGGGRAPNNNEREVFALWEERGLNRPDFSAGNLIAFLKQFRRVAAA